MRCAGDKNGALIIGKNIKIRNKYILKILDKKSTKNLNNIKSCF